MTKLREKEGRKRESNREGRGGGKKKGRKNEEKRERKRLLSKEEIIKGMKNKDNSKSTIK